MTQTFAAQVAAQVAEIEELMLNVFRTAVQDTVEEMLEPGPSMATAAKVISKGAGKVGRGKKRKELFGPIANPGGGGNLPIDTGYLRASFSLAEDAPKPRALPPQEPGKTYDFSQDAYLLVINSTRGDRKLFATFSANYAAAVEYGFNGQPARGFVRLAAQNWQRNVDRAVARAKGLKRG